MGWTTFSWTTFHGWPHSRSVPCRQVPYTPYFWPLGRSWSCRWHVRCNQQHRLDSEHVKGVCLIREFRVAETGDPVAVGLSIVDQIPLSPGVIDGMSLIIVGIERTPITVTIRPWHERLLIIIIVGFRERVRAITTWISRDPGNFAIDL